MDAASYEAQAAQATGKDYRKLVVLAILHMAQYFPAGLAGAAIPFLFRKEGLPLEMFWLLAIPGYTRFLKWAMALVVDNFGNRRIGRRKSWIIPCTLIGALSYAVLALFPPSLTLVHVIVGILLFKSFVMAAQDIAVDAYAAESMTDEERPLGTSLINFLGGVAGTIGTGAVILVDLFGWETTMIAASAMLILAALPAVLRKEPPPPEATQKAEERGERPSLVTAFRRKDSAFILPFMFLFGFGASFLGSMIPPFWADRGLSTTEYGVLSAIGVAAGGALAATVMPWLVGKLGLRRTATIGLAVVPLQALMYFTFNEMENLPDWPVLIGTYVLAAFGVALYSYAASISRFRWASKAQAGTDYALQSSIWNLGVSAAASVSGFVVASLGWSLFFPVAAATICAGGLFYLIGFNRIERLVQERELAEIQD
jgi:MFS family permease